MYKKILLPTDGSTYADQEVERVNNLLAEDGEVIILSVAGILTSSAFQPRRKVKKANEKLKKDAKRFVDNMAAKFSDDINVTKMVVTGFPAAVAFFPAIVKHFPLTRYSILQKWSMSICRM